MNYVIDIYGQYEPCVDKILDCNCKYVFCEHTSNILKEYGSGIYKDDSIILKIIRLLLSYQEDSLKKICEFKINLKPIVEASGFKLCNNNNIISQDCKIICENNYKPYIFDDHCTTVCKPIEFTDEIYLKILRTLDYIKYPNRNNIKNICDIFGWSMFYTNDYLNIFIGNDDIYYYQSILKIIPLPIGTQLRILTNC